MAFEEVGSKIIIHKVTEYTKDVSSLQKGSEILQSGLQAKAALEAQKMQQQIQDVYEPSEAIIRREQRRNKKQEEEQKHKDQGKHTEGGSKDHFAKDEPRKIDIEI